MPASICLVAGLLAQLLASDPQVVMDDFITVDCPHKAQCFFLDAAGGLFFSPDAGESLQRRSDLSEIGPSALAFTGLIDGWALDPVGRLWASGDGGRSFAPCRRCDGLAAQTKYTALAVAPEGPILLGTNAGQILRGEKQLPTGRVTFSPAGDLGPRRIVQLLPLGDRALAALDEQGNVFVPGEARADWLRVRPLEARTVRLLRMPGGVLLAGGCKGGLALSRDAGRTWKPVPWSGAPGSTSCLWPLGAVSADQALVSDRPGQWLLVDLGPTQVKVQVVSGDPSIRIRHGQARAEGGLILAGQAGVRGLARVGEGGKLSFSWRQGILPATTDLRLFGKAGAIRARADGILELSTDSGAAWQAVQTPGPRTDRVDFADRNHGYAIVDRHEIRGTVDGGRSWRILGRWPDLALFDLSFADARTGWVVGESGAVLRTIDGGKNWTLDKLPSDNKDLNRVQFVDRRNGWAVGGHQVVFRTQDGGKTWTRLLHGRGNLYGLHFLDQKNGFVAGDDGMILATTDGGQSWEKRPTGTEEALRAVSFADPSRGLAGGGLGKLFVTRDGGRRWRRIETHTRAAISAIACYPREGRCLVAGERGVALMGYPFRMAE